MEGGEIMKLALECPTKMLEQIQPFADFDYILANKVLSDNKYADYYKQGAGRVRFLDNGVNEKGEPVSVEDLKKALDIIGDSNTTFVIALDWVGDALKTIKGFNDSLAAFGAGKVIPVLQGASPEEVLACLGYYISIDVKAPALCIPYRICGSVKETHPEVMALRRAVVVSKVPPQIPIHLLGFNSPSEFSWYKDKGNIVSIDTGIPIMLGLQGKDILDGVNDKAKDTYSEMDTGEITKDNWAAICRNIALMRTFLV